MLLEIFSCSKIFFAVIFCAAAVKIADDFLDVEIDKCSGRHNWSETIGNGAMIYAMLFLGIAVCLNVSVSLSLFFCSYIVGMFQDLDRRFSINMYGWQECLVVFVFGSIFIGMKIMIFSLFFLLSVQLFDDCIDAKVDYYVGNRNLAHKLGKAEAYLLSMLTLLISWWVESGVFFPVLCATVIFYCCLRYQEVRENA